MRRRFILAFVALFALFAIGIVISLVFIWRGSTELRSVLASHQIEDLRQSLSLSLQRSQKDLQVSGTVFANQLDDIIANVQDLDQSVQGCFGCHHEPALQAELEKISALVQTYKQQYSTFITAFLNRESRQRLQFEAAATAEEIDNIVDALLMAASPRLQRRTQAATAQVERSWTSLLVTLLLTFVGAIAISSVLTRGVTEPLSRLVRATDRIAGGEMGSRIEHQERHELGSVMDAFNAMSETLDSKTKRIDDHVEKLFRLNEGVVSLYAPPNQADSFARQVAAIDGLMDVGFRGNIVPTGLEDVFLVSLSPRGETTAKYKGAVSAAKLEKLRNHPTPSMLVVAENELEAWPFGAWAPRQDLRNYLVCWVHWQGEFRGALLAANKTPGDFEAEDCGLLVALGNVVGPALEHAHDYRTLQEEVEQLKAGDESEPGA